MKDIPQKLNIGIYHQKNITVHIKREYGKNKRIGDIINSLIMQGMSKGN